MKSSLPFTCLAFILLGSQTLNATAILPANKNVTLLDIQEHWPIQGIYQIASNTASYPEPQIKPKSQNNTKRFPGLDWKPKQSKNQSSADGWKQKQDKEPHPDFDW